MVDLAKEKARRVTRRVVAMEKGKETGTNSRVVLEDFRAIVITVTVWTQEA